MPEHLRTYPGQERMPRGRRQRGTRPSTSSSFRRLVTNDLNDEHPVVVEESQQGGRRADEIGRDRRPRRAARPRCDSSVDPERGRLANVSTRESDKRRR